MATIDNLTLEIQADSSKAVTSLNNLANALKGLKTNLPTKAKLENTAKGFKTLTDELSKISTSAKNLDKIKAVGTIAKNLNKLNDVNSNVIKNTAKGVEALSTSVSGISYESIAKLERLTKALSIMPQKVSVSNVKKVASAISTPKTIGGTSTQTGSTATGDVTQQTKNSTQALDNFWTKFQTVQSMVKQNPIKLMAVSEDSQALTGLSETLGISIGAVTTLTKVMGTAGIVITVLTTAFKVLGKVLHTITAPLRQLGEGIKQFINKLKKLPQAFLRIALYRTIRSAIKAVSQAVKEGLQNLALYSKAMEELDSNKANNVMSRYASSFLYFKNAIATAVMPVLRALVPVVETVINKLVDLINVIAQVGSAFLGNTDFTKAKYFWVDYADSLDNATGSAKKLHHQLAGFDELNNLTDNSGSGSGKLQDASQMFEEATISAKLKAFGDKLRGFFGGLKTKMREVYDFFKPYVDKIRELATEIKERVQPNLKKIWETMQKLYTKIIKPFITGFTKGFLDVMLGDTYDTLPEAIGAIADKFGDLAEQIGFVLDKVDDKAWERFGTTLGTWFGWFVKLNAPISKTLSILSLFKPAFEEIDKIATLTFYTIGYVITRTVITIKQSVENYVSQIKNSFNFGSAITEGFRSAKETVLGIVSNLIEGIKRYFSGLKNSTAIGGIFSKLLDEIVGLCTWLQNAIDKINTIKGTTITVPTSNIGTIASGFSTVIESAQTLVDSVNKGNYSGQTRKKVSVTGHARADGGFVPKGDLFVANEQGAEMIGSVNNRTAVANNEMITEAIATATYNAMSRALSENNGNVTITVEGDGEKMFRVFQKKQREYQRATGLVF